MAKDFLEVRANIYPLKKRMLRFKNFFTPQGMKPTLEEVGNQQLLETLERFDVNKVDYLNRPLKGLTEDYYKWKVRWTGIPSQNIGILTGRMRSQTFTKVEGNTMTLSSQPVDDKGRPYAHYFQKERPIYGFSPQGTKLAIKTFKTALKRL